METNHDLTLPPMTNLPSTEPTLIVILSTIRQTIAENSNLIISLTASQHRVPVASQEAKQLQLQKNQI